MGEFAPPYFIEVEMRKIKVMDIIRQESERTGVPVEDIIGEKRTHEICHLRHYCMWRAKIETGLSYPQIGRSFGNKDHTSVLNGVKRIESMPMEERRWDPPKVKMKIPDYSKNDDMMPPKTIFPIQPIYKVA